MYVLNLKFMKKKLKKYDKTNWKNIPTQIIYAALFTSSAKHKSLKLVYGSLTEETSLIFYNFTLRKQFGFCVYF